MRRGNGSHPVIIFILFAILISALTAVTVSAKEKTDLSARAATLYEPSSERFLYSENGNARLAMASTTKIMTALIAAEELKPDEIVKVPKEAVGTEGSSAYFEEGEEISVKDLLYALLLRSANDAAVTIAIHTSGSIEAFSLLMNDKADSLGLSDTNFKNPHGLHDEEHYTSAEDLAKITAEALKNPLIKEIASTKKATVTTSVTERTFLNHNKLLHLYDDCIGVKTGFTKNAGRCLVGAAERDGVLLISVTLDAPNDWRDHERLLNLGFELTEYRTLARHDDIEYTLPVLGSNSEKVCIGLKDDIKTVMLKTDGEIKTDVCLSHYLCAPIKEGQTVGKVYFTLDGKVVAEGDLVAKENIDLKTKKGFFTKIKEFLIK